MKSAVGKRIMLMAICLAAVAIILFYGLNDPSEVRAPRCFLKAITGYDCPGCGAQRALHALLHGNIAQAWHYNPALFFLVPLAAAYGAGEFFGLRNRYLDSLLYSRVTLYSLIAALLIWWVARNL